MESLSTSESPASPYQLLGAQYRSSQSNHERKFWAFKLRQLKLPSSDGPTSDQNDSGVPSRSFESCLSEGAKEMIALDSSSVPASSFPSPELLFDNSTQFNWDSITTYVDFDRLIDESEKFYSVEVIKGLSIACHSRLRSSLTTEELVKHCLSLNVERLIPASMDTCMRLYQHMTSGLNILAAQTLVSWLEKGLFSSLMGVYFYNNPNCNPDVFPTLEETKMRKMKDILEHSGLQTVFQRHFQLKLRLLKTFVGTIDYMNIRNILWHGFITPNEFPASFVVCVANSRDLLPDIQKAVELGEQGRHSPHSFPSILSLRCNDMSKLEASLLTCGDFLISPAEVRKELSALENLVEKSVFVVDGFAEIWKQSFHFFASGLFYEAMMCAFPVFENSLRGLYVCVNSVPSARMTAENDALCLSLDIILAESITREHYILKKQLMVRDPGSPSAADSLSWGAVASEKSQRNAIFDELGASTCNALFDLLVWVDSGYRLRDQLAHMTADPSTISNVLASHTLCILVGLLRRYTTHKIQESELISKCDIFLRDYRPCFHPKISIISQLRSFRSQLIAARTGSLRFAFEADEIFDKLRFELYDRDEKLKKRDDDFQLLLQTEWKHIRQLNSKLEAICPTLVEVCPTVIQAPVSEAALSYFALTRQLLTSCERALNELCSKFEKLRSMCVARTAYKRQRLCTLQLHDFVPFLLDSLLFLSNIIQEGLRCGDYPPFMRMSHSSITDRPLVMLCMLGALNSCIDINMWGRAIEVVSAFCFWDPSLPEQPKSASPQSLIGAGETVRLWGNLGDFFRKIGESM